MARLWASDTVVLNSYESNYLGKTFSSWLIVAALFVAACSDLFHFGLEFFFAFSALTLAFYYLICKHCLQIIGLKMHIVI